MVSKNWTKRVARMIDKDAQKHWEKNYKADCSKEECVGEAETPFRIHMQSIAHMAVFICIA